MTARTDRIFTPLFATVTMIFHLGSQTQMPPSSCSEFEESPRACTALHDAAWFGRVDMIRFILDGGSQTDVQVLDKEQLSPTWHVYLGGECLFYTLFLSPRTQYTDS